MIRRREAAEKAQEDLEVNDDTRMTMTVIMTQRSIIQFAGISVMSRSASAAGIAYSSRLLNDEVEFRRG